MCNLRKIGWLMVLSGTILTGIASIPVWALTAEELLNNGLAAADRKDYATAKQLLSSIVTLYPQDYIAAGPSWKLGFIANKENNPEQARSHFQWVIANFPSTLKAADARLSLALMARADEKPYQAIAILNEVIALYPKSMQAKSAKLRIAMIWNLRREYDKVFPLAKAVIDDPEAPPTLKAAASVEKANAHLDMWRVRGDIEHLRAGITLLEEIARKYPDALKEVALSQVRLAIHYISPGRPSSDPRFARNPAKARAIMEDALSRLPPHYCTWWMKVEVMASYQAEDRFQEALTECESILIQNPPDSWREYLLYMKGDYQLRLEQTKEGIISLKQVITEYPNSNWAKLAGNRIGDTGDIAGGEEK